MADLDLRDLDRIPMPDLWPDARSRTPGRLPPRRRRPSRAVAGAVALVVAIAGVALGVRAFVGGTTRSTPATRPATTEPRPAAEPRVPPASQRVVVGRGTTKGWKWRLVVWRNAHGMGIGLDYVDGGGNYLPGVVGLPNRCQVFVTNMSSGWGSEPNSRNLVRFEFGLVTDEVETVTLLLPEGETVTHPGNAPEVVTTVDVPDETHAGVKAFVIAHPVVDQRPGRWVEQDGGMRTFESDATSNPPGPVELRDASGNLVDAVPCSQR